MLKRYQLFSISTLVSAHCSTMWCLMITLPQPHNQPVTHHLHNRQTCLLTIGSTSLMVIPTSLIISDWPLNGVLHTAMSQKIWHCPLPVKHREIQLSQRENLLRQEKMQQYLYPSTISEGESNTRPMDAAISTLPNQEVDQATHHDITTSSPNTPQVSPINNNPARPAWNSGHTHNT
jgi:hypothetical protein